MDVIIIDDDFEFGSRTSFSTINYLNKMISYYNRMN